MKTITLEYQHEWKQITHPSEEKHSKQNGTLFPYSIFHLFSNNQYQNDPYYLLKGVNTSAEWIKKGQKTWSKTWVVQLAVWALPEQSDSTVDSKTITATNQWSTFSPQPSPHARTCSLRFQSNGHNLTSLHMIDKGEEIYIFTGPPLTNTDHIGWFI